MNSKSTWDSNDIYELQQRIAEYEDEVAYKKLFFHLFLPLKSFSFAIIKSKETAEEIVSDIFLDIWIKRKELCAIQDLKMYLYTSVRNNSLRKLQQNKKVIFFSLDEVQVEFASPDENAEAVLLTHELSNKIDSAIDQLPERCKLIFKLAKEDKLKYREIALLLNISIKTIDNQLATALKKIAAVLNIPTKKPSSH
jgi:RNA polymerase sigma-70 factor (ECF subfamily)